MDKSQQRFQALGEWEKPDLTKFETVQIVSKADAILCVSSVVFRHFEAPMIRGLFPRGDTENAEKDGWTKSLKAAQLLNKDGMTAERFTN